MGDKLKTTMASAMIIFGLNAGSAVAGITENEIQEGLFCNQDSRSVRVTKTPNTITGTLLRNNETFQVKIPSLGWTTNTRNAPFNAEIRVHKQQLQGAGSTPGRMFERSFGGAKKARLPSSGQREFARKARDFCENDELPNGWAEHNPGNKSGLPNDGPGIGFLGGTLQIESGPR